MAPRLSASPRKNAKLRPVASDAPSVPPAGVGHNQHGDESERVQLISIVSQLSAAEDAIEIAKGPLKAAQKKRSQIIGLGKAAGFTAKELQARLDEMNRGTRENAEQEARERKHRRWLGIIEPDQASLILGTAAPQSAKDEAHWKGEGYKAGLRQMPNKAPPECPAVHEQAYMKEHERGLLEVTAANAPKASVREQAAADFEADNAPEPGSPEAAAAERKAIRAAKEGLNKLAERQPEPEPEGEKLAAANDPEEPAGQPVPEDDGEPV